MESLVKLSEQEIRIDFALGCKCRTTVTLTSRAATFPIAFKVQTSSPNKFRVNPPSGLIPPLSSTSFQVILKPQTHIPPSFPRSPRDRFLIRSAPAPELAHRNTESTKEQSELVNSWFNSVPSRPTQDFKLKVAFLGRFLLRHAVSAGAIEAVRSIITREKSVLSEFDAEQAESLYKEATRLGDSGDMVNLLIEGGLRVAAAVDDLTDEVERLVRLDQPGPLDCGDEDESGRVLARAGAKVDARGNDGQMVLKRVAAKVDRRMMEMLLEMRVDPTGADANLCRTAVGHERIVKTPEHGQEVLHAARRGELELLESLLERGGSVGYVDKYGLTALHVAAIKGHRDAAAMLVEFGANLNHQDAQGHTPLHLAVEGGSVQTVEVLINRGADLNCKTTRGVTPLAISRLMEYDDISQLLLNRGAIS